MKWRTQRRNKRHISKSEKGELDKKVKKKSDEEIKEEKLVKKKAGNDGWIYFIP